MFNALMLVITMVGLVSCTTVNVSDYKNEKPTLSLEKYLNGSLIAHGFFQDRKGLIKQRFTVDLKGTWIGDIGTLEEDFLYSDGKKSRRVWTIKKQTNGSYTGTASDVIGEAKGEVAGNALQWKYTLALDVDGTIYNVQFDDWMYLMDDKVMINKSKMYKFGIYLGEVTLSFYKK